MSRCWLILLPQDQWNPTSCQDILHFPKPALYFGQMSDSKTTLQEPDTSQTAVSGRKPSGPASHLTCGEVFIMITFIAVLAKIGRWVYAPVTVKPQGRGIRHTQDRLTFNFLHKGGNTEAKYLFLGGKFCFVSSCRTVWAEAFPVELYDKIIFIVCRNKQSRIKGEARLRPFPLDAARVGERVGKNKGKFSPQRQTNSDVADNETSAHDPGHS